MTRIPHPLTLTNALTDAIGDFFDSFWAETVLEAFEDFFAAVADNLGQPDAAVDVYEEGAFVEVGGLGVGGDGGIDGGVPDFDNLGIVAAGLEIHVRHEFGEDFGGTFGRHLAGDFQRGDIDAAPLGKDTGAGGIPARPARQKTFRRRLHG